MCYTRAASSLLDHVSYTVMLDDVSLVCLILDDVSYTRAASLMCVILEQHLLYLIMCLVLEHRLSRDYRIG